MLKPDYLEGSIVNLMASIGGAIGSTAGGYAPLEILPPGRLRRYRTIVLLLVDGLGYEFLAGNHPGSRLFQHCERPLTSVFPPTTASAVTSFFTAVAPQQHAITGWFTYLEEVASVATVLPFHPRLGGPSYQAQGITLRQIIGRASMFDAAVERACHVVTAGYLVDSEYSAATGGTAERHGYRDLDGLFEQLRRLVVRAADPQYLFAYWPQLDGLATSTASAAPR